jgi:hypothetical protein
MQVVKHMACLAGQPIHPAFYTVVNEFEECQTQSLTLTKCLSFFKGAYEGIAKGLEAHGHPPTALMYTDNAMGRSYKHLNYSRHQY